MRASPGCLAADWTGTCFLCQAGTAVSGGVCIVVADMLHLTFEQNILDLSGNQRHGFIQGTQEITGVFAQNWLSGGSAPEGNYAIMFNVSNAAVSGQSPGNYITVQPFVFGGGICGANFKKISPTLPPPKAPCRPARTSCSTAFGPGSASLTFVRLDL
jgi:hypothetical protein